MNPSNWVYTEKVKDHFMNPRNILEDEDAYQADGRGVTGNIKCGDEMVVVIKVANGRITDCKWKTFGCASAIASTSVLSEMVRGMPLDEAWKITAKDVNRELGGLPEHKIHCSVLGDKALRLAINDYYARHGMADRIIAEKDREVCHCMNVTEHDIEEAVLDGARTFYEVQEHTKVGTVCGECLEDVTEVMKRYILEHFGDQGACAGP